MNAGDGRAEVHLFPYRLSHHLASSSDGLLTSQDNFEATLLEAPSFSLMLVSLRSLCFACNLKPATYFLSSCTMVQPYKPNKRLQLLLTQDTRFSPGKFGGGGYLTVHKNVGDMIDWYNIQVSFVIHLLHSASRLTQIITSSTIVSPPNNIISPMLMKPQRARPNTRPATAFSPHPPTSGLKLLSSKLRLAGFHSPNSLLESLALLPMLTTDLCRLRLWHNVCWMQRIEAGVSSHPSPS